MKNFESMIRTIRKERLDVDEAYSLVFSNADLMAAESKLYPLASKFLANCLIENYAKRWNK